MLNKGLKFAQKLPLAPLEEIIVDVESNIQFRSFSDKEKIRSDVKKRLMRLRKNNMSSSNSNYDSTIRSIKAKDVIVVKADKGNNVVLMDKSDYEERIMDMIANGPYEELKYSNGKPKSPLNEMVKAATDCKKLVCDISNDRSLHYRLKISNPRVATLYALPKIHKNPVSMRPICSNVNVPTEQLSKWLLETLKKYPVTIGCSIKNSVELVDKIKNVKIKRGQILCSFDLQSMYTNIPVSDAIECLKKHLTTSNAPPDEVEVCVAVAQTCMNQNFFTFRQRFYKQNYGLTMGSKLSPYLANIYMCALEEKLKKNTLFPPVWLRYVDDVFCITNARQLNKLLELLNSQHQTIKFTVEQENESPF